MNHEPSGDSAKAALAAKLGIVFAFLFAFTWALPSVFNWVFFWTAAYCFFLYWYYQPRNVRVRYDEPYQYRTTEERAAQIIKKVVRIAWITGLSLFLFFLAIGVFTGNDNDQADEQPYDDTDNTSSFQTDEAVTWNEKAYEFYLNRDYDSAVIYYDRILRLESGNANAWYSKALVYYDQQIMDQALESFARAYDLGMRDAFLSHVLAYLYDNSGNTSRAIGFYKEAVGMDSTRSDIYTRLGELEPSSASKYKALEERWKNQ